MNQIKKIIQKYIKPYKNDKNEQLFKIVIPDGRGGQIRKQGFISETDAKAFAQQKYLGVLTQNKGLVTQSNSLLFRDYSQTWLDYKRRNKLSEGTAQRYQQILDIYLNPFFGCFKMMDLEKFHLRKYIEENQKNEVTSSVISFSTQLFKTIIKQAEIDDIVSVKGIRSVPTPIHESKDPQFWDFKEMTFFLNLTFGHKLYDLWKFTLFTGLRAGEVAGLQWDAIHFDREFGGYTGCLEVKRIYNQKTGLIEDTTKNGDKRIVPLLPEVKEILMRLKSQATGPFVFGNENHLDSSHFNRQLKNELKKYPTLKMIKFHGLRHSFCSYLDSTGLPRRIVAEIMGHRDIATTNIYSHVSDQSMGHQMSLWLKQQSQQKTNNLEVVNF